MKTSLALFALTAALVAVPSAANAQVAAGNPCAEGARVDSAQSPVRTWVLCSTNPGRGAMDKELWSTVDGVNFKEHGFAPRKAITAGFAAGSDSLLAIAGSAADQCVVFVSANGGDTWDERLTVTDGAPAANLQFTDATHGSVTCGFEKPVTYVTVDAGRTWTAQPN
ncbi:WD40/YVTN/BNR-like repeat-containing protein [Kribbella sp. NPDC020789]